VICARRLITALDGASADASVRAVAITASGPRLLFVSSICVFSVK
jgi:hypothetical protein